MPETLSPALQPFIACLATMSPTVAQQAVDVAAVMQVGLSEAELTRWMQYCVQLAQSGWHSWESTGAFVQVSPLLLQRLPVAQLWEWAEHGQRLARTSTEVASAFWRAARPFVQQASQALFAPWVEGGHWYLKHHPTVPSLAVEYFQLSPHIYGRYALPAATLWSQLGQTFVQAGRQHLHTFFTLSRAQLDQTPDIDLMPAWQHTRSMLPHAVDVALLYLERYPDLLRRLGEDGMTQVAAIVHELLTPTAADASTFVRRVGTMLGFVPAAERMQALAWCQQVAAVSHAGVIDFLQHLDTLRRRLPGPCLQLWITTGLELARRQAPAGEAYFALESATAQDRLHALQNVVTFAQVERVLQLYTEAFLQRRLTLRTTTDLPHGWYTTDRSLPTSDGSTIFVPPQMEEFATAEANFAAYKMAVLHQIGFYECGTFAFRLTECWRRLPALRLGGSREPAQDDPATAFEGFFVAFLHPPLARSLFTIFEDARIDAALVRRYKGMRDDLALLMRHSLQQRPALLDLPLQQALLEGLLQLTLGATVSDTFPPTLRRLLRPLAALLTRVQAPEATVYETAVAVYDAYRLLSQIPAHAMAMFPVDVGAELATLDAEFQDDADTLALADLFRAAGEGADRMPALPESPEPAVGVEPVPYRGDIKPELIQKKMRLDALAEALQQLEDGVSPLSPEALKALLENNQIDIKSLQAGELTATSGLFVTNLEGREGVESTGTATQDALRDQVDTLRSELQAVYGALEAQPQTYLYDEWDYLIGDYRRAWCRLSEIVLDDEGVAFVEATRQQYADLLAQVLRQFQMLKPEMFKKVKRLTDGEEIDLDSAIEAVVDRRAGNILSDRVYMRRNKRDRSVAAVFLLDMSASTDDEIKPPASKSAPPPPAVKTPRQYDFSGFVQDDYYTQPSRKAAATPRRRIIDVEKEALVLMAEALEALGDAYAVYGFSGYGRDQVEAFIVKEFHEAYAPPVQGRIGAIKPHRSTRMGPAIRHALRQLERQEARVKTLLLLSDGYPQDFDYGKDRKSKEYGIQDTMMALHEARLKGVQTFCITVDPSGHDYLRQMCPDQQYLVIEDITELPSELPKVYRGLTT